MEQKKNIDLTAFKLDDFFSTQEQRDEEVKEKIEQINLNLIDDFPGHPFKVTDNDDMRKLEESISENGVLEPIIIREKASNRYEIISGHNRVECAKEIGFSTIPSQIVDCDDEKATLIMLDTNLNNREKILPVEKGYAYKTKKGDVYYSVRKFKE